MRLSTEQVFNRNLSSILQKQSDTSDIVAQLSSGKRVNVAGDDPVAAVSIDNLNQKNALVAQYVKNIDYATNRLAIAESKFGSAESVIISIRERVIHGANGSLSLSDREMIANDMQEGLDALLSIANARDESGNYIFAGFSTDTKPFSFDDSSPAEISYNGDSGVRYSLVQLGVKMLTNVAGDTPFMNAENSQGDYFVSYDDAQQGFFKVDSAIIADESTYVEDTYSFDFSDNGAGGVDLVVSDSGGATVTTVTSFDDSNVVSFNGIEVTIEGVPDDGDTFTMAPQSEVSIFDTFSAAIDMLQTTDGANSPTGRAQLAQILGNIDNGLTQVGFARGITGNALHELETYSSTHAEESVINASAMALLEDLDYPSAITEFEKHQLALNAVSTIFSRVGSVSLFDFI